MKRVFKENMDVPAWLITLAKRKETLLSAPDGFTRIGIILQLRRKEGISKRYLEYHFEEFSSTIKSQITKQIELGNIYGSDENYILSRRGKYIADAVSSSLFV